MKYDQPKIIAVIGLLVGQSVFAGSTTGGGGPPAKTREELLNLLKDQDNAGGIFSIDPNNVGLGIKGQLKPELTITYQPSADGIAVPKFDFQSIQLKGRNIEVEQLTDEVGVQPVVGSYRVFDGDNLGSIKLLDRRTLIRAGEKNLLDTTQVPAAD